jgi:hypothetical protein
LYSFGEDDSQLIQLLDRCVNEGFSLAESCWMAAQPEGMAGVEYDQLMDHAEDFATLDAVYRDDGWLARFIGDVLDLYRFRHGDITPEFVLSLLAQQHGQLMASVNHTRLILRNHPGMVQGEIRKAAAALDTADQDEHGAA